MTTAIANENYPTTQDGFVRARVPVDPGTQEIDCNLRQVAEKPNDLLSELQNSS